MNSTVALDASGHRSDEPNVFLPDIVTKKDIVSTGEVVVVYVLVDFVSLPNWQRNKINKNINNNTLATSSTYSVNIFTSLANGTFMNVSYNFNADVFQLIGRQQSVLSQCTPPPSTTVAQSSQTSDGTGTSLPSISSSFMGPTTTTTTAQVPNNAPAQTAVIAWMMLALYLVLAL